MVQCGASVYSWSSTLIVTGVTGLCYLISTCILSFPCYKVTIGPWIQDGFYYDFHCPSHNNKVLSESDLKEIKKEMDKIIKKKLPFIREEVTR